MGSNRQYKDSVFSFLFSDPAALRELYGAITGIELTPDTPVTINTLEGVLYKNLRNDISFEVDKKLVVLVEHESTINPNMAVRLLMYIARVYEKLTAGRNLYGRKKLSIPRPEFIVLYNGTDPYPDEATLKLSEAFEDIASLGIPQKRPPDLELTVKVYNINRGHNEPIIRRCKRLEGYSALIAKVREFEAEQAGDRKPHRLSDDEKEEAMTLAVRWCIAHNILKPFLESHGSEVVNMLMTEWKLEDALVIEREEGR
ncbi:MAG: Rpn family recombination-promoting nuclease/putative transposase, partial [Treponema sp.]|nr:Rpn family recombination-promoting nuclease/putative transposase [Treponema sp.]